MLLLSSAIILTSNFNVSFANTTSSNDYDEFSKNVELIEINEWKQYEDSEESCKTNSMQKIKNKLFLKLKII